VRREARLSARTRWYGSEQGRVAQSQVRSSHRPISPDPTSRGQVLFGHDGVFKLVTNWSPTPPEARHTTRAVA